MFKLLPDKLNFPYSAPEPFKLMSPPPTSSVISAAESSVKSPSESIVIKLLLPTVDPDPMIKLSAESSSPI